MVAERKFSEMLERAMRSYNNRSLTAAEVIAELVELAKEMKTEHDRGATLGLRDDELAFYDAVCQNDSAVMETGRRHSEGIAQELVDVVRRTPRWTGTRRSRSGLSSSPHPAAAHEVPLSTGQAGIRGQLVMQQAERLAGEVAA